MHDVAHVYSAHVYSAATIAVVEAGVASQDAKPFFVYLAYANTHEPLEAPQEYVPFLYHVIVWCSYRERVHTRTNRCGGSPA